MKKVFLIAAIVLIVVSIVAIEQLKVDKSEDVVADDIALMSDDVEVDDQSRSRIADKEQKYPHAVELVNPDSFINSEEFTLADHIGKDVILVDFWTYSCINCQRTLPYLTAWHEQYGDKGLLIVGVHTPEFAFEKDRDNVIRATKKWGVEYPVVQDNEFQTWRAYNNRYWPRKYLIDIDGFIVYDHIGEGAYEETEEVIRELLEERAQVLGEETELDDMVDVQVDAPESSRVRTPESYFGYDFERPGQLGSEEGRAPGEIVGYARPEFRAVNKFYLDGAWLNAADYMELQGSGSVALKYYAKDVHIVAGADEPVEVRVILDGELIDTITVDDFDLYTVVDGEYYGDRELILEADGPLRMYTYTFG